MSPAHVGPQLPIWFWLAVTGIFIGGPAVVIAAAVALRSKASRSALRQVGQPGGQAQVRVSRASRYGLGGLGVGVLLGAVLVIDGKAALAVLSCAGGYLAGVLLGECARLPRASGPVRVARLLARKPVDYVPRWAAAAAMLAAVLVLAAPVAFALAPVIRYSRWHPVPGFAVTLPGGQTSWPPVFPGTAAAAVLAIVVLGVGAAGLRRVTTRPGPADAAAQAVDDVLRRQAGRAIAGAVLGLELVMLAGLLIAGSQGLAVPMPASAPGAYAGNRVMVIAGLCCAAAGLVSWLVLSGWTRRYRAAAMPPDEAAVTPES